MLAAIGGDSNSVGIGVANAADSGFLVNTPTTAVAFNTRYATATGPPPTFTDFPALLTMGSLGPYAAPSLPSMGIELTLGRTLLASTTAPAIMKMAVSGSTLAVEWLPTGTYPAAGPGNLYRLFVAQVRSIEALTGRLLDFSIWNLGTNDAANAGQAAAFGANMTAIAAALRVDFGASHKIVWLKTNVNCVNANTATVRTAQASVAALDAGMLLIDNDDILLAGDGLHYLTNGYLSLGQWGGYGALDLLGVARATVATTPDAILYGPESHGTGNLVVVAPGGEVDGDLEVLVVVCGKVAGTITEAGDWTQIQDVETTASGETHRMGVFTRPVTGAGLAATGHMAATTVTVATAARNAAKIFTIRGPNLNPTVDASSATTPNAITVAAVPTTVTGVTTTANNALVLIITGGGCGTDGTMAVAASGLTNVREIQDTAANILSDREIINLTVGTKASFGATGNFSMTPSNNMVGLAVAVAIKP
jgi:carbohydrate esterase-like sialic acid-specific acetylesterase